MSGKLDVRIRILVDDRRDGDGIICRTIEAAKIVLSGIKNIDDFVLLIDHDIGDGDGKDGVDLLKWARDNEIPLPKTIAIVSDNPVGAQNMASLITNDLGYTQDLSRRVFTHD